MRTRLYRSSQALYGVANALYWKSSERQISTHLTVLKHQNTKTSLCKLSENHWVFAFFEFFGSVRKTLQSTVFNDHPVALQPRLRKFAKTLKSGPFLLSCVLCLFFLAWSSG